VPVPLKTLWSPDLAPDIVLPFLAWAVSVDVWRNDWPETLKRQAIRASLAQHRRKGSVASVRDALAQIGFAGATIIEGGGGGAVEGALYDGTHLYDGAIRYDSGGQSFDGHWATYRVEVPGGLSEADFALIEEALAAIAPVRSHLVGLVATGADGAALYDGAHLYDGSILYA